MSKKIILYISIFLFFITVLHATEQGYIEWKPIKGAFGYKLEIRDENKKLIIEEVVNSTRYLIKAPSGKYEFRISPMNVFEKTTVWSYWNPLNVVISKRPVLSNTEHIMDISDISKSITLKGKNFLPDTKCKFISGSKIINTKSLILQDPSTISIVLSSENVVQGKYDIILENPGNRTLSVKNFLTLTDKDEAERLEAERLAKEKAERERLEAERLAKEKAERDRLEAERLAKEKAERDRLEAERLAKDKAERDRLEAERLAKEKAEKERLEAERLAKDKAERDRLEAERLAREKAERDRLEAERLSKDKAEQERLAREKAERERLEAERLAKDKAEQERLAREKAERERLAREKAERDRLEAERLSKDKAEQERLAREKAERERLEAERLAREKAERERLAREKAERDRLAREALKDTKQRIIEGIEDSSNREYSKVGSMELDIILDDFKKSCSPSKLLDTLVEKCYENHSVLKMGSIQKNDIINYLYLNSENYRTRIRSYNYFMRDGTPFMKAALEKLQAKVSEGSSIDLEEREFIKKAINYQQNSEK